MIHKKDLFVGCNEKGEKEADFVSTFCNRCRNTECVRAGGASSAFDIRVATQVERLFSPISVSPERVGLARDFDFSPVVDPVDWVPRGMVVDHPHVTPGSRVFPFPPEMCYGKNTAAPRVDPPEKADQEDPWAPKPREVAPGAKIRMSGG